MPRVDIPERLAGLLKGSDVEAQTLAFADAATDVLRDNKTPFFPAYTDHGTVHVERVLRACDDLIPDAALRLLEPMDAAVLVCASILHDLGMHLRGPGFVALVTQGSGSPPLPWFCERHGPRPADEPWPAMWQSFKREARHFGKTHLDRLLGPDNRGVPAVAYHEVEDPASWTDSDWLLIGEFLRRHHARLSHEIALRGFPGGGEDDVRLHGPLASAAGVVARSHGESLRLMVEYVKHKWGANKRPAGALLPYAMGLIRVADYLQLDADRAPAVLLRLKQPQSRQSIEEWNKHRAIAKISWHSGDPGAVFIEAGTEHRLRTHLALETLVRELEDEMDTTTAVLSELYGSGDFDAVRLSRQRVQTNLHEPGLHEDLPFVPRRAALRSDEDLFRLVIRDLYRDEPVVAGRELLQNAVDAVRERARYERLHGELGDVFRDLPADVLVEVREVGGDRWELRVADRGIGMTPEVVIDYFLSAGATFAPGLLEADDREGPALKAGRFGVGAMAGFLLGDEIRVTTRHVAESAGIKFTARIDDDLVELEWDRAAPCGTEVIVPFELARAAASHWFWLRGGEAPSNLLEAIQSHYWLSQPRVAFALTRPDGEPEVLPASMSPPAIDVDSPLPRWRRVDVDGFEAVYWTVFRSDSVRLSHNGIEVSNPESDEVFLWAGDAQRDLLDYPLVAVFDPMGQLGLSLDRFELRDARLPFEEELVESIGLDIVAHALVHGARQHPLLGSRAAPIFGRDEWCPPVPGPVERMVTGDLLVLWALPEHTHGREVPQIAEALRGESGELSWQQHPFRGQLHAFRGARSFMYDVADRVEMAVERWRRLLRLTPVASLTVTTNENARLQERDGRQARDGWQLLREFDSGKVEWCAGDAWTEADRLALEALSDLSTRHATAGSASIAFTIFRRSQAATPPPPALGRAWVEIVGGGVPRSESARVAYEQALRARHPRLEQHVQSWRALK